MKAFLVALLLALSGPTTLLRAAEPATRREDSVPTEAKTVDDILKSIEPLKGFGELQTAEFRRRGCQVFSVWYCPFSGRGDCYLSIYYQDFDKKQWTLMLNQLVKAGGDLSLEMPSGTELVVRDSGDIVLLKVSTEKVPRKN